MTDNFFQTQWRQLGQRLEDSANFLAKSDSHREQMQQEVRKFSQQPTPKTYQELLERVRMAAEQTILWHQQATRREHIEEMIDETNEESFPASDPPSFSRAHA